MCSRHHSTRRVQADGLLLGRRERPPHAHLRKRRWPTHHTRRNPVLLDLAVTRRARCKPPPKSAGALDPSRPHPGQRLSQHFTSEGSRTRRPTYPPGDDEEGGPTKSRGERHRGTSKMRGGAGCFGCRPLKLVHTITCTCALIATPV